MVEIREDPPEEGGEQLASEGRIRMGGDRRADTAIVVPVVAFVKIVVELHTYFREGGEKGHNCSGASYHCGMRVPWSRRSSRRILLYVHVPFLATAHPTTVRRIHHGSATIIDVAPTQLHLNSWAYLRAFRLLCMALYLEPSPRAFLYFFVTRPKSPITWLSVISRLVSTN